MKLETNKSGYIISKKSKKIQINLDKFGFYKFYKNEITHQIYLNQFFLLKREIIIITKILRSKYITLPIYAT